MSPVGGQGMNTGFANAELVAFLMKKAFDCSEIELDYFGKLYTHYRSIAARAAIGRAHMIATMIGTITNPVMSALRNMLLGFFMRTS